MSINLNIHIRKSTFSFRQSNNIRWVNIDQDNVGLFFDNTESVDCMIEALEKCRDSFPSPDSGDACEVCNFPGTVRLKGEWLCEFCADNVTAEEPQTEEERADVWHDEQKDLT